MNHNNYYEDEVSLKELILILIHNWKIILTSTAIALLLSAVYIFAIADEVYESSLGGNISETYTSTTKDGVSVNAPNTLDTAYGLYYFPTASTMDYLNLLYSAPVLKKTLEELEIEESSDSFMESITIETVKDSNGFRIKVTGKSPKDAVSRITALVKNFSEELQITYKERAISYFIQDYSTQIELLKETLEVKQKELVDLNAMAEDIPQVITVQNLLVELNPNYITLQGYILDTRKVILETQQLMDRAASSLEELNAEYAAVQKYRATGDRTGLDDNMLMVMESKIYLNESPSYSDSPIAPRKSLTLAVALLLGLMLGVFIAFFKEYWKNDLSA